ASTSPCAAPVPVPPAPAPVPPPAPAPVPPAPAPVPPPAPAPVPPPPSNPPVGCDKTASPGAGTAQALLASLSSGQVGCLHGGTYTASGVYVLDFSKSDVSIVSYPGETAVVQGIIVDRNGADRVRLSSLKIVGTGIQNSIQGRCRCHGRR